MRRNAIHQRELLHCKSRVTLHVFSSQRRSAAVSVGVPRRGLRTECEEWNTAFTSKLGRPIQARRNERLVARERDNTVAREFHQVACRRRSRNPEVTRREGVHRGTACLAMLRGAMTALASPPSSPPKQPPLSPHPPTLVPSDTPATHMLPAPADTAGCTATMHPSLPLVQFQPSAAPQPPTAPRCRPSCFGPTNAILIGRKGGIQERKDLPRTPRGDHSSSPRLLTRFYFLGFSSIVFFPFTLCTGYSTRLFFLEMFLLLIFFPSRGHSRSTEERR